MNITSPADASEFITGQPITFTAEPVAGDPPYTYHWSSSADGAIGEGDTLQVSTLSAGQHVITVLAQDSFARADRNFKQKWD